MVDIHKVLERIINNARIIRFWAGFPLPYPVIARLVENVIIRAYANVVLFDGRITVTPEQDPYNKERLIPGLFYCSGPSGPATNIGSESFPGDPPSMIHWISGCISERLAYERESERAMEDGILAQFQAEEENLVRMLERPIDIYNPHILPELTPLPPPSTDEMEFLEASPIETARQLEAQSSGETLHPNQNHTRTSKKPQFTLVDKTNSGIDSPQPLQSPPAEHLVNEIPPDISASHEQLSAESGNTDANELSQLSTQIPGSKDISDSNRYMASDKKALARGPGEGSVVDYGDPRSLRYPNRKDGNEIVEGNKGASWGSPAADVGKNDASDISRSGSIDIASLNTPHGLEENSTENDKLRRILGDNPNHASPTAYESYTPPSGKQAPQILELQQLTSLESESSKNKRLQPQTIQKGAQVEPSYYTPLTAVEIGHILALRRPHPEEPPIPPPLINIRDPHIKFQARLKNRLDAIFIKNRYCSHTMKVLQGDLRAIFHGNHPGMGPDEEQKKQLLHFLWREYNKFAVLHESMNRRTQLLRMSCELETKELEKAALTHRIHLITLGRFYAGLLEPCYGSIYPEVKSSTLPACFSAETTEIIASLRRIEAKIEMKCSSMTKTKRIRQYQLRNADALTKSLQDQLKRLKRFNSPMGSNVAQTYAAEFEVVKQELRQAVQEFVKLTKQLEEEKIGELQPIIRILPNPDEDQLLLEVRELALRIINQHLDPVATDNEITSIISYWKAISSHKLLREKYRDLSDGYNQASLNKLDKLENEQQEVSSKDPGEMESADPMIEGTTGEEGETGDDKYGMGVENDLFEEPVVPGVKPRVSTPAGGKPITFNENALDVPEEQISGCESDDLSIEITNETSEKPILPGSKLQDTTIKNMEAIAMSMVFYGRDDQDGTESKDGTSEEVTVPGSKLQGTTTANGEPSYLPKDLIPTKNFIGTLEKQISTTDRHGIDDRERSVETQDELTPSRNSQGTDRMPGEWPIAVGNPVDNPAMGSNLVGLVGESLPKGNTNVLDPKNDAENSNRCQCSIC